MTRDEMFLKFAINADVSVYNPIETLRNRNGRQPTIVEVASYVVELREIEANKMMERFYKEPYLEI